MRRAIMAAPKPFLNVRVEYPPGGKGKSIGESQRWSNTGGLAWKPGGDEAWTAGEGARTARDLIALSLTGKERIVLPAPGMLTLHDIDRDGRVLFGIEYGRREIMSGSRSGERDFVRGR